MILTSWTIFSQVKWSAIWKHEAHAWITSSSHVSVRKYTVFQLIKAAMDILPLKYFGYPESLKNLEAPKIRSTLWVAWSEDEGGCEEAFCVICLCYQGHLRFCLSFKLDTLFAVFGLGYWRYFQMTYYRESNINNKTPKEYITLLLY